MVSCQHINTPELIQSEGFVGNCAGFTQAGNGDTCWGIAERNGMKLDAFLKLNPQIENSAACSTKVWPGHYYCVHTKDEAATSIIKGSHTTGKQTAHPHTTFSP